MRKLFLLMVIPLLVVACGKEAGPESKVVSVQRVIFSQPAPDLIVGESYQLSAGIYPSDATVKTITWSSSDATVASVDQTGLVQALKAGKVSITAEAGGVTASCPVTVLSDEFYLEPNSADVPFYGGFYDVTVKSSRDYHISSMSEWVQEKSVNGKVHKFRVEGNPNAQERSGVVVFCDEKGTCLPFTVKQAARPEGAAEDWTYYKLTHQSLFMRFTATWCQYCPRMNKAVQKAKEQMPGKIQHLALHGSSSDLAFSNADALAVQYAVTGYPTGIVDGRVQIPNYEEITTTTSKTIEAVKETEKNYKALTGVDIVSTVSGNKADIDLNVYVKKVGNYKVTVLLLEDDIIHSQSDCDHGLQKNYEHDDVARIALTAIKGDAFSTAEDDAVVPFSYSATIPASYKVANMSVLVYVQRTFGSDPVLRTKDYGDYFVDNCARVKLGDNLELEVE